ncbi:hypothetical protein C8Q76DRAFT_807360 [Earliella scabrosa]|nr:hypothetical protein C8Q76DRAFT_807360 [Earliella scabrosa]
MASYNYTDSPNVNLVCCICRSPFVDPCTTRTCCHTFCYECIAQAIAINRQCPIDRTPLSLHDLVPADPVIRNLVDELTVRCPQEHLGCTYTCQRLLLPVHLTDSCQYVEVTCSKARCTRRVLRKDIKEHQCSDSNCDDSEDTPEQSSASAPNSSENPNDTSSPSGATTPPSADLVAENAMLRLRLSALESVVHTLRNEMLAVKHALGPWYRPDVQPESPPEDLEASTETFERQLAEDLAAQSPVTATTASLSSASRDPTDIASYFPPAEDPAPAAAASRPSRHRSASSVPHIYPPQSAAQTHGPTSPTASYQAGFPNPVSNTVYANTSFQTPGQTPGMPYSQGPSFPATSPAAISIPPLDPMTPLPDTLASLHSTSVTLAGALGALAATRGAESLRTNEELRALRGAMHGLRMQVHDILTSRTHLAGASGAPGGSANGDNTEPATFNLNAPGWLGYGPRPYGIAGMHHPPPPFGVPPVPPPTNITKL